jgi:hypothetical protein
MCLPEPSRTSPVGPPPVSGICVALVGMYLPDSSAAVSTTDTFAVPSEATEERRSVRGHRHARRETDGQGALGVGTGGDAEVDVRIQVPQCHFLPGNDGDVRGVRLGANARLEANLVVVSLVGGQRVLVVVDGRGDFNLNIRDVGVPGCGNGFVDKGEQCDGADLGGQTCQSATLGTRPGGLLGCSPTCAFDTSRCTTQGSVEGGAGGGPNGGGGRGGAGAAPTADGG